MSISGTKCDLIMLCDSLIWYVRMMMMIMKMNIIPTVSYTNDLNVLLLYRSSENTKCDNKGFKMYFRQLKGKQENSNNSELFAGISTWQFKSRHSGKDGRVEVPRHYKCTEKQLDHVTQTHIIRRKWRSDKKTKFNQHILTLNNRRESKLNISCDIFRCRSTQIEICGSCCQKYFLFIVFNMMNQVYGHDNTIQ